MGQSNISKRKRTGNKNALSGVARGFGAGALIVLAVVAVGIVVNSLNAKGKTISQTGSLKPVVVQKSDEPADASSKVDGKYYGLCKQNSIHSVRDFRNVVRNDPVLAAHFAGFNWDTARLEKQERDVWTYVSYRKGEVIRRTTKAVRLPKGDGYITDGTHVVRTYCCNDYVLAPPPTVAGPADPVERVDAPPLRKDKGIDELPPHLVSRTPIEDSPDVVPESHENVTDFYSVPPLFYGNRPDDTPGYPPIIPDPSPEDPFPPEDPTPPKPPPDNVVVPEPGTIVLVGVGAGILFLFCLLRRKRISPH